MSNAPASAQQVGGNHYKNLKIQPGEFLQRHRVEWLRANAVKYLARHRNKNKLEDVKKALHYIQLLREWERPRTWWEKLLGLRDPRMHWMGVCSFLDQFVFSDRQAMRSLLVENDLGEAEHWMRIIARAEYKSEI